MSHLVQDSVIELIKTKRFYGELLLNMKVQYTTRIPTAGVSVSESINLVINPHFWNALSLTSQAAVLEHECRHILSEHFTRGETFVTGLSNLDKMKERMIMNVAMDLAINEHIPNLPKTFKAFDKNGVEIINKDENDNVVESKPCTVENYREKYPDIKNNETFEYYYHLIHDKLKEEMDTGQSGDGTIDDHSIWDENAVNSDAIKAKIREAVNRAAQNCGPGRLPGDVQELIDRINYSPRDWKKELRTFVASSVSNDREPSRKVRNRRYGILYSGYKKQTKLKLAVILDSSGSMYLDLVNQCFAEINQINKTVAMDITLIQCDTEVRSVETYDPKKKLEVIGRGGTAFAPALKAAADLKPDAILYFTDGENYDVEEVKKPRMPIMWVLPEGYENGLRYTWGRKVTIAIKKKS